MDRMTERERYRTLGTYLSRDRAQLRPGHRQLRQAARAVSGGPIGAQQSRHRLFQQAELSQGARGGTQGAGYLQGQPEIPGNNYVLYAMYAGDFATAETGARQLLREDPKFSDAYFPLAMALLAKGRSRRARGRPSSRWPASRPARHAQPWGWPTWR